MKKAIYLLLFLSWPLVAIYAQSNPDKGGYTLSFKLHLSGVPSPDSVAVACLLFPSPETRPIKMNGPNSDGYYNVEISFPDSVLGKTLLYRYRSGNQFDIRRNFKFDKNGPQSLMDRWSYLDGLAGKVKPAQPIVVFQANTAPETAELAKPFVGITNTGKPVDHLFPIKRSGASTKPIKKAVTAFLEALSPAQRSKCTFPIESNEWRRWHNIEFYQRTGIGLEELNAHQKELAFGILKESLSTKGLQKSRSIMKMEAHLATLRPDNKLLGGEKYWFTFMGTPSAKEPWGWQIDGHHLVINYFVLESQIVMTPTFMGSEPTYAESGINKGLRTFEAEESRGLDFYQSLNAEQKAKARLWDKKEMDFNRTEAFRDNEIIPFTGISAQELTAAQQEGLLGLIAEYVEDMSNEHANIKMLEVLSHLEETYFTWVQGEKMEDPFYYRIHSPVILIEFDHQTPVAIWDRSKPRPGPVKTHIHTVVRTPNGNDYGKDLLREHLEARHRE